MSIFIISDDSTTDVLSVARSLNINQDITNVSNNNSYKTIIATFTHHYLHDNMIKERCLFAGCTDKA